MHNNVERNLEDMLPALEALKEKRLFSQEELKMVLNKRSHFEYAIKSSTRTVQDFYRYLEYEMKLEELRRLRQTRLKKEDSGEKDQKSDDMCDFCITRHIHSIFSRATFVFKWDVKLWKQWFEFCRASNSNQRLSKALTDALKQNPSKPEIWIYAAQWEFEDRQNTGMARSLMQQGLRNCSASEDIWLEYFRLELEAAERLQERRRVLFNADRPEKESDLDGAVDGAAAMRVFQEAVGSCTSGPEFRKRLLEILDQSSLPAKGKMRSQIEVGIVEDFQREAEKRSIVVSGNQ